MANAVETEVGFPIRNLQIALRTVAEQHPEIDQVLADGIYGAETTRAVSQFQRLFGLPETGNTDRDTWHLIHDKYFEILRAQQKAEPLAVFYDVKAVLKTGDTDDLVSFVQLLLRRTAQHYNNFRPLEVTGVFDAATEQEVLRFQAKTLLPETGTVDRTTWDRLARLYRTLLPQQDFLRTQDTSVPTADEPQF